MPPNNGTTGAFTIFQKGRTLTSNFEIGVSVWQNAGAYQILFQQSTTGGNTTNYNSPALSLSANTWYHIAVSKVSATVYYYLNDGMYGISTIPQQTYTGTGALSIGNSNNGSNATWSGYITNLRFLNGTGNYTGTSTPPISPLTNVANTSLLLTVLSNPSYIIDSSPNAFTVTNNGGITFNTLTPVTTNNILTSISPQQTSGSNTIIGAFKTYPNLLPQSGDYVLLTDTVTGNQALSQITAFGTSYSGSVTVPVGQASYTTAGTYIWTAPAGVTNVSVVAVGAGGFGSATATGSAGGGGLFDYSYFTDDVLQDYADKAVHQALQRVQKGMMHLNNRHMNVLRKRSHIRCLLWLMCHSLRCSSGF